MCFKQKLKDFLSEISENAEFPVFNYVSSEKYSILVKCHVDTDKDAQFYSEYASEWIKKFTKFTKTGWIVRACFPRLKRLLYRKVFMCHHSSFNKSKISEQGSSKDKQCKAKIDFKVKFINRNTIRNDKMLKAGLNLAIYINFVHTHSIRARESYNFLKCSADTDKLFLKYFAEGHTVATAKSYHELMLLSNYGAGDISNAEINPSLRHISYVYHKRKSQGLECNIPDVMAEKMKSLEECGGVMRYTDDHSITVVITPFMKNVISGHELDSIIIDSTHTRECVASFFFVPTPLGALPIACTLHSQISEPSFSQAFFSTKLLLENQTLKSFEPRKIMINQIDEQNHALDAIFSNTTILVSKTSLVEDIWKTLCAEEVKYDVKQRQKVMELYYSLLHAATLENAESFYQELETNKIVQSITKLKQYLFDIWLRREEYITPNRIIDISLRTLKQFIVYRCKSYTSLAMIDVLTNILDKHWCQILHAHLSNKLVMEMYTKYLPKDKNLMKNLEGDRKLKRKIGYLDFGAQTLCCDCIKGKKGMLCEHLCAILHTVTISTSLPDEKRAFYTALAGDQEVKIELVTEPQDYEEQYHQNHYEETQGSTSDNEQTFRIKQEIEHIDPLDIIIEDNNTRHNSVEIDTNMIKKSYVNGLRALNDEFRRLNKLFRDNPNASNLETMGRLARELGKIRPVEKVNISNMCIELTDAVEMDCD
ncbi:uncharacterized protein LOC111359916 [Spodoptera litura]|uniref:Uncharacterized protein LOC111359916 n=1 Tax=Spodoptera litura TaxID=69820 RepID=A0A9J7EN61_SPOLT|nr:uncharacterized protein LOC111359916 [Spodoptera litura]